ncbi:MAG: N-acetylmuramoyl-L-alanine amidase [Proteobacteria bacterium]|uniref:N-acetylmuramoyl-L-alanine amidase n=1 Tax=Candidatus Fonsibacter lacus TaxID=2576439 RepID=A0A964UZP8_9PROT|nr:N-acetylmuramoyl-L-alanine amidase [Candidatus Fonsibacter lacus]NCU71773.1 N-acetylmuramoyl-L-alanine amidase [Candidatus Fonsibacter lacus]
MKIKYLSSPNYIFCNKRRKIHSIVIHYTGMRSLQSAVERLISKKYEVSSHYLIGRTGKILQLVKDNNIAWHAGISNWFNFKNLNKTSIGIELENKGHQYGYQNFSNKQINQLIKILEILKKKFNIQNINIIGHSDIATNRKKDPGEKFPWKKLYKKDLAIWHSLDEKFINNFRLKKLININKINMLKMIKKLGYSKVLTAGRLDKNFIRAFQRRYRQELINGIFDQECYLILNNLQKFI